MDFASLIGVITGVVLLFWAIFMGGSLGAFWHPQSLMITLGGTFAATLLAYPLSSVISVGKVLKNAFVRRNGDPSHMLNVIVQLSKKARREGLLALEEDTESVEDPYFKKGLQLVVDGTDPELLKNILETEIAFLEERHKAGQTMFETMGSLAPAFGMIGTLIGLIQMLKNLSSPESIGPGMAVALVTTFYGALLANLLFLPIAAKLRMKSAEEVLYKELILEGVLSIQAGDNPRIIEEKLKAFLSPTQRQKMERAEQTKAGEQVYEERQAAG